MNSSESDQHTILVVDDDRAVRDGITFLLEGCGYRVIGAEDGRQALRRLEEGLKPCLILLDLDMPRFDGDWFLDHQRQDQRFAAIPTVIVSALEARGTLAGLAPSLPKPIPVDELLAIVEVHCPPSVKECT